MTHAGTITIGVDIDGGDLGAKLGAAVRKALAPMLADLQSQLAKTNKSLTGLDGAGLGNIAAEADKAAKATDKVAESTEKAAKATEKSAKSTDKAAASQKKAKAPVDQLAAATAKLTQAQKEFASAVELYGKKSPQAEAAYKRLTRAQTIHSDELIRAAAASKASTASQINDYERLARAAEESAARQAAAARAAGIGAAGAGGGGSGGGRGGGGGGGGRFGASRLTSPGMLNLGALGAAALPAAATAVVNLTGAVQALAQAGLVLPGVFAAAASSVGTAVIGFHGMKDAISALNDAAKSGDPKDLEKATEALKDMDPAAVAVAKSVSALTQGPLKDLQKQVAGNMFVDVDKSIDDLAAKSIPTLKKGLGGIGTAWNNTFKELGRVGGLDSTQSFLDRIFGNTAEAQNRANKAIEPLTHAFGTLAATGTSFLPRLADGLTNLATRFDNFITKADQDGRLSKWIDEGFKAASNLGTAFLNVGKIITDLTGAAGGDGGFLKWLADVTGQLHTFLSSTEGQTKLKDFFAEGKKSLDNWMATLKSLIPLAAQVIDGFRQWGEILLPIIRSIADGLSGLGGGSGLVAGVVTAFLGWKTITGLGSLLTGLGKVDSLLGSIGGKAGGLGGAGGLLSKLGPAALVAGGAALLGNNLLQPADGSDPSTLATLGGVGANVAGGGAAGFMLGGPIGAAVGATLGAVVSVFEVATREINQEKAKFEEQANRDFVPDGDAANKANRLTGRDLVLQPSLATPNVNPALTNFLQQGGAPGFKLNPDGTVTGPDGTTLPGLNLSNPGPLLPPSSITDRQGITLPPVQNTGDPARPLPVVITNPTGLPGATPPTTKLPIQGPVAPGAPPLGTAPVPVVGAGSLGDLFGAGLGETQKTLDQVASKVENLPTGEIKITDPSPEVLENLTKVDAKIEQVSKNEIVVKANDKQATDTLDALVRRYTQQQFTIKFNAAVSAPALPPGAAPPGRAGGGVFPGYAPGVDSILSWVSPGEGVLIPEAVRAIGGSAGVYAINSMFRSGLSRQGYASGGVIPGFADGGLGVDLSTGQGTGPLPGPGGDSVIGLLSQIRDLLAGKGGVTSNPLAQTADGVQSLVSANGKAGGAGTELGPFGTPKKKGNPAYEMAAAAISALGGDPEKFLGSDPSQAFAIPGVGAVAGGGVNVGGIAAALKAFATSGDTASLAGTGLGVGDSVVKALITARNKKKDGLSDDAIAALVDQVLTGGGFSGTVDSTNSALIGSLTTFSKKLAKGTTGTAAVAGATGVPMTQLPAGGLDAFAAAASGGKYSWGSSDLAAGLSDCSGAVSDLVELITEGQATSKRLFSTNDAGSVLSSLGGVSGAVPGMLQIGWSQEHMRATLPSGVNFESGGQTGQGATYGGNAQGAAGMPNIMSLPAGALGAGGALLPGMGATAAGGTQAVFVTNWPGQPPVGPGGMPLGPGGVPGAGGPGGATNFPGKSIMDAAFSGVGGAGSDVAGSFMDALLGATDFKTGTPTSPTTSVDTLLKQRNPNALAAMFGFDVPDYTREGGDGGDVMGNVGVQTDSKGRMYSDTATLIDRSFSDQEAANKARFDQQMAVLNQIKDRLGKDGLEPIMQSAITSGVDGLSDRITSAIGTQMGQAAGPVIADAVHGAISSLASAATPTAAGNGGSLAIPIPNLFDEGGIMPHATTGINLSGSPERVLSPTQTRLFDSGLLGGWNLQPQQQHFATTSGVIGNDTVGAEWFGVSEIPIIGTIVNLLVRVLLKMIGVNIEVRDTLDEMSSQVRQFRGDFQKFDATGRLFNDTSGLIDRSHSSEQAAADERIRILKIVIEGIVKFIIEKIIVPIGKAVANAAIQAGAAAAGAAVNSQAPGAGGIVSALISGAGTAAVDIVGDLFGNFATSLTPVIIDLVVGGLQTFIPDLMTTMFSGGLLENLLVAPITGIFRGILSPLLGAVTGGIFAPFTAILGGLSFDDGGVASGVGIMPKATIAPERVLSPRQTDAFERMVSALDRGAGTGHRGNVTLHAPITVVGGGEAAAKTAHDKLLALLGA